MKRLRLLRWVLGSALAIVLAAAAGAGPPSSKPPAKPAKVQVSVAPEVLRPGDRAEVTLTLSPLPGIKINRYPKIKLDVPESPGLVAGGKAAVGNDAPPPIGQTESNYFKSVEPIRVSLDVDRAARSGVHEVEGQLTYFYCVSRSGFCAPSRVAVKIPLEIR